MVVLVLALFRYAAAGFLLACLLFVTGGAPPRVLHSAFIDSEPRLFL